MDAEIAEAIVALRQQMRAEFTGIRGELAAVRAHIDDLPLTRAAIESLRSDVRTLRAAVSGMARINITAGEVEALHADIDRMQTKQTELESRIIALERNAP
jgi:hypothetical protein